MDIDDALRVINGFLDAEYELTTSVFTEPDDGVVAARRRAAEAFLATGIGPQITLSVGRRAGMTAEEVAADAPRAKQYTRRHLFKVYEHANPLWGRLFAGVAGSPKATTAGNYARMYFVADTEAGPRIVGEYDIEVLAENVVWKHGAGAAIDAPGPVVDVRRLEEPTRARDRAEWAS